jgi:hypothetical protein
MLPDGTVVELTLISALISGNIRIVVYTSEGVCESTIIPFRKCEKFLICTSDLSSISLNTLSAECNVSIICRDAQLNQIDVDINLCAIISSFSSVVLEVQGRVCKPRKDELGWCQGNDEENDQPNGNIDFHCIKIEQVNDSITFSTGIQLELPSSTVRFSCRPRS